MMGPEPKSATTSVLSDLSTVSESPFGNQILRKEETYHGSCAALSRLPLTRKMNQGYPNTARLKTPSQLSLYYQLSIQLQKLWNIMYLLCRDALHHTLLHPVYHVLLFFLTHHILHRDVVVQAILYLPVYSMQPFPVSNLQRHSNVILKQN